MRFTAADFATTKTDGSGPIPEVQSRANGTSVEILRGFDSRRLH